MCTFVSLEYTHNGSCGLCGYNSGKHLISCVTLAPKHRDSGACGGNPRSPPVRAHLSDAPFHFSLLLDESTLSGIAGGV
jgi:hypothetical protein